MTRTVVAAGLLEEAAFWLRSFRDIVLVILLLGPQAVHGYTKWDCDFEDGFGPLPLHNSERTKQT